MRKPDLAGCGFTVFENPDMLLGNRLHLSPLDATPDFVQSLKGALKERGSELG